MEPTKSTILAIDDNKDNLVSIKALMRENFPDSVTLTSLNGPKGLELARSKAPDVILLDVVMPGMDGFEVCKAIKADPRTIDIPVIFITALKDDREARVRALEAGGDALLAKPIDALELTTQLKAMLKVRSLNLKNKEEKESLADLVKARTRDLEQTHIATLNLLQDLSDENEARKIKEAELSESETRYRNLIMSSPDAIVVDHQGMVNIVNQACLDLFGAQQPEALQDRLAIELFHPDARSVLKKQFLKVRESGQSTRVLEVRIVRLDGSFVDVDLRAAPFTFKGSNDIHIILRDISERKRSEEQIRLQAAALENAANAVTISDMDYNLLWANPAFTALTGYTLEEALGRSITDLIRSGVAPEGFYQELENLHREGESWSGEMVNRRKDGSLYTESTTYTPVRGGDGRLTHIVAIRQDISERKLMEEAVRRRVEQLAQLNNLGRSLAETLDLPTIYRTTIPYLQGLVDCPSILISFVDEEQQVLRAAFVYSDGQELDASQLPVLPILPDLKDGRNAALTSARPVVLDDLSKVKKSARKAVRLGSAPWPKSAAYIPMQVEGHVIGLLEVQSYSKAAYSEEDAGLLGTVANQVGLSIQNARLLAEKEQRLQELGAFYNLSARLREAKNMDELQTSLTSDIHRMLNSDVEAIVLVDEDSGDHVISLATGELAQNNGLRLPAGTGLTARALATHRTFITTDYASESAISKFLQNTEKIGPALFVPMFSGDLLIGVLVIGRLRGPTTAPFSQGEVLHLESIANITANALRRISLFDSLQLQLQRTQALNMVERMVASSMDLNTSLDVVLGYAIEQLGMDAGAVLLFNPTTLNLEHAASRGFQTRAIEQTNLRLGEGMAGRMAMQRKTHFIKNVESEAEQPTFLDYLKREGLKVFMGAPLIAKGQLVGVLELFARSPVQVAEDWQDFLDTLANQAAVSIDNLKMFNDLQRTTLDLTLAYDATIEGWSQAMDLRDKETEGHTQRVTELTMLLARRLGLSGEQLVQVRRGALLHDIGKLGVPDSILHKPGSLDPDERREIQKHPNYAYEMLYPIAYLKPALEIPYCHHEKWDGTGYPRGLKGEQIPIEARIFSVVDVWDALTNERPYREAWSQEKTLQYIRDETERFFDPNVVEVFLKVMEEESEDYKKAG